MIRENIFFLGDVHLGRNFKAGAPLHRKGARAAYQWRDFRKNLELAKDFKYHIQVGDIFDKSVVPLNIILRAYEYYSEAALANPHTKFYVLRGNHDASKDLTKTSAFEVFKKLCERIPNVTVVDSLTYVPEANLVLCPWDPVKSASEIASQIEGDYALAVGHYDLDGFGQNFNVVPTEVFAEKGIAEVITGHVHLKQQVKRHGVTVQSTGSMQPYTHAEDPEDSLYRTYSLDDILLADPEEYKDMCVRVDVRPGEILDMDIDCFQLTVRRVAEDGSEVEADEVDLGNFDLDQLFKDVFTEFSVPEGIATEILEEYRSND